MIELVLTVGAAVFVSAICNLFEAVLYSVPTRHVEAMSQAGKPSGKIFKKLRANIDRSIAAVLCLNTIANTAGAALAGSAAANVLGHDYLGYFAAFFTLAILIFSEILPKTTGVIYARSLISTVAYSLSALVLLMRPAVWLSSLVTRIIARRKTEESVTAEEIQVMARLGLRTGGIKPYQEQIIDRILTLHNKKVKDVMTPRTVVFSLSEHLTLKEASQKAESWEHSRFPVYDEDMEDVVGIVLTKEVLVSLSRGKDNMQLTELMRPAHFVVETATLNRVLTEFLESREHLFVVLDEYGGLSGLITLEDILEEILGREIVDESDVVEDKRALARQRRKRIINRA